MTLHHVNNRLHGILMAMGVSLVALTDQANFNRDLGLDSLDVTDMLTQVEYAFGIRIPDEDWWTLQTFGQLSTYLVAELTFDPDPTPFPARHQSDPTQPTGGNGSWKSLPHLPF